MDKTNKWIEELDLLTQIIQQFPLEQTTKWGGPVFTYQNKNILSFAGFKNHFALWFFNGSHLTDPYQVLSATQGEKTKNLRQWRFTDRSENKQQTDRRIYYRSYRSGEKRIESCTREERIHSYASIPQRSAGQR
ncbi:Domain of uncharacterised function (DU1801) [Sphingobacterium spiritivorum]|uniref:Domain of uncharacterized function (DU1801) n=1 Tax=Sphingobacterium spiritivorum TaxID=258 RepID=A0A380BS66_SPHSI|nr:Domain of uncharacterised function (DU1801) [Sphingobacterium spiritivorum]